MGDARYQRVKEVYFAACEKHAHDRGAFLESACNGDHDLRCEVERLLKVNQSSAFLQSPLLGNGAQLLKVAEGSAIQRRGGAAYAAMPVSIGRYRILRVLGEGGMGTVYLAQQDQPQRSVAVKVIHAFVGSSIWNRFQQEVEILGRLQHPGIAQIYDAGIGETCYADGTAIDVPFFAMEYIDGSQLVDYAEENSLNTRERLQLLSEVCDAVQIGHLRGVIHRDLKPGNILVDCNGRPKVIDFGVARLVDQDGSFATMHTLGGQIVGTLAYMSPEQVTGRADVVDLRSDIYSLGVIGYELISGRLPFNVHEKSMPEAARIIRDEEPSRLSSISRTHRGDVETIIAKALEKDPTRRYASAADLAADIRRYLSDEPIQARPPSMRYQLGKFARRHKEFVAGLAIVFLALVVGIVATTAAMVHAQRQATTTQRVNEVLQEILGYAKPGMKGGGRHISVVEMLDAASEDLAEHLQDLPETELVFRQTLGDTYAQLGLNNKASDNYERAYELAVVETGPSSEQSLWLSADRALSKANSLHGQGDKALTLLRRLSDDVEAQIARARSLYPSDHKSMQRLSFAAAVLQVRLWRTSDSEQSFRELLAILERAPERQQAVPLDVVKGYLAFSLWLNRKHGEAKQLAHVAADVENAPSVITHLIGCLPSATLAFIAAEENRLPEAENLLRKCLDLQVRVLGEDHPSTIDTMTNLAPLLMQQQKWEEARLLWQRQRQFHEATAPSRAWIAYLLWYEANMLAQQNRMDEAAPLFVSSIARFHGHPETDLSWLIRTRAIVQMGLQTGQQWAGEGLRQCIRDTLFAPLHNDGAGSLSIDHALRQFAGHSDIGTTAGFYLATGDGMADRVRQVFAAAG